jgi:hypothetical protein
VCLSEVMRFMHGTRLSGCLDKGTKHRVSSAEHMAALRLSMASAINGHTPLFSMRGAFFPFPAYCKRGVRGGFFSLCSMAATATNNEEASARYDTQAELYKGYIRPTCLLVITCGTKSTG